MYYILVRIISKPTDGGGDEDGGGVSHSVVFANEERKAYRQLYMYKLMYVCICIRVHIHLYVYMNVFLCTRKPVAKCQDDNTQKPRNMKKLNMKTKILCHDMLAVTKICMCRLPHMIFSCLKVLSSQFSFPMFPASSCLLFCWREKCHFY